MARKKPAPLTLPLPDSSVDTPLGRQLATLDDKGNAPKTRVKSAQAMYDIYVTMREADKKSAHNRAILQEMLDGGPPHSESALREQGLSWVYNLNFLGADTRMGAALVSYDDLADSSDYLIHPEAIPGVLPPEDLQDALDVVSEEYSKMIREQSDFYLTWTRLATEFVGHGVGFGYYPDAETPWWEAAGWGNALIPRNTMLKDEAITIFTTKHSYRVDELWQKIKDPSFAAGWNVNEVKKAIVGAANHNQRLRRWTDYWTQIEKELKNNDLGFGLGDAEEVAAIHYWQREFDGSYSFYIGLEDGTNQDYLYKDENRYENVNQAIVSFTLSAGTTSNFTFHSIRGALWKMYALIQTENRFLNKFLTNTDIAMTLLVQGEDGESYDDMQITLGQAIGFLPAGAKVVDRQLPDVGTQGVPVLQMLGQKIGDATGAFQSPTASMPAPSEKGNPATRYEIQSYQQQQGSLTSNSVSRFYRSMDRLLGEQFRRVQKIGPDGRPLSGGKCAYPQVKDLFTRCEERGVPAEFIQKGIRKVTAARSIGNGSPQMRMYALDQLQQLAGELDETGRALLVRDKVALLTNRMTADRYAPKVQRIPAQAGLAEVENAALNSADIPVLPDQQHRVHLQIHVPAFQQAVQQLVQTREQNPEADFTPLVPVLQYAFRLHTHSSQHVQMAMVNPLAVSEIKDYKAALEQGGNLLAGFARELQSQERHQTADETPNIVDGSASAQGQPQQAPGGAPAAGSGAPADQSTEDAISASNPKYNMEIQLQQAELQHKLKMHGLAEQLASAKVAQIAQSMRLTALETDSRLASSIQANQATTAAPAGGG